LKTIGERLQKAMNEKGISNYRLATDLKINKTTIANYINDDVGRPNSLIIANIANYLSINRDWLLTGKGEMAANTSKNYTENYAINTLDVSDLKHILSDKERIIKLQEEKIKVLEQNESKLSDLICNILEPYFKTITKNQDIIANALGGVVLDAEAAAERKREKNGN